jgi:hypothetical protein
MPAQKWCAYDHTSSSTSSLTSGWPKKPAAAA